MIPSRPTLSVIVPFFNEEEVLSIFLKELREATDEIVDGGNQKPHPLCEVILIDDGSTDGTRALLAQACLLRANWRVVALSGNHGQAAALYTGIKLARGDRLVLLDGDGQNHPADIRLLLALLQTGVDIAVGVRVQRRDGWQRRIMSKLANTVRQRVLRDGVRDTGCGLKAMTREVAEALLPIRTLYSFIPAMAAGAGFRVAEIAVTHRPRGGGKSKYGIKRFLFWPLLDMLGVWWFVHRRCPINCTLPSAANIIPIPPALESELVKA